MKFDVVIGNQPYQEETDNNRDSPIYHFFMDEAYKIAEKVSFITPARFLFNAGQTPKSWNEKMLNDEHLKVEYYEQDSSKIFPNTDIKGGIVVTYRDSGKMFGAVGTFTHFRELNTTIEKVVVGGFQSLNEILYGNSSYKLSERIYKDFPQFESRVNFAEKSSVGSNIFDRFHEVFFDGKQNEGQIQIFGRQDSQRIFKWINSTYIKNHPNLDKWKVFVPGANGTGAIGEVLSTPLIGQPLIGYTQTFISFGAFESRLEAENLLKYLKTKFSRTMLGTMKITQNNKTKEVWKNVPIQNFTPNSDINWSKSIPEIDRQLYAKYELDEKEIAFIEEKVRAME